MPPKTSASKTIFLSSILITVFIVITALVVEGGLRVKNLSMKNYEIEMWRYAKELKVRTEGILGHRHKASTEATLQSVKIRLNERGLRGAPLRKKGDNHRVVMFLGSSITFGWGVDESQTITSLIEQEFKKAGKDVEVLNAGIGNYNAERYVELFLSDLKDIEPTDIVVHSFLRDVEVLEPGRGNWLLQNSQLAVTGWNIFQHLKFQMVKKTVDSHYSTLFQEDQEGFKRMKAALTRLSDYSKQKGIRLYLALTPEIRNLVDYPFEAIHSQMGVLAKNLGYEFVDLLPALRGLRPEEVWSLPEDPHPNALGHQRMAHALFPVLNNVR